RLSDAETLGEDFAPPVDIFTPEYGLLISPPPVAADTGQVQKQYGVDRQGQLRWENLILTVGVRHDWTSEETNDRLADATARQSDHAFTERVGLSYPFGNGIAPYLNYSRSFQPTPGTDFSGRPFDPVTGKQSELGVKYSSADSKLWGSA